MMDKKLVILGAGQSGVGAAILGKKMGYEVLVSDQNNINTELQALLEKEGIRWEAGQHTLESMQEAHLVVKSPGIPSDVPLIKTLKAQGKTITRNSFRCSFDQNIKGTRQNHLLRN